MKDLILNILNEMSEPDYSRGAGEHRFLLDSDFEKLAVAISSLDMTQEKVSFEKMADTSLKYINEHHHPHTTIIITPDNVEVLEGFRSLGKINGAKYIKD